MSKQSGVNESKVDRQRRIIDQYVTWTNLVKAGTVDENWLHRNILAEWGIDIRDGQQTASRAATIAIVALNDEQAGAGRVKAH